MKVTLGNLIKLAVNTVTGVFINAKAAELTKNNEKVKLNLGCGSDIKDGWINIDYIGAQFLNVNLSKGDIKKIYKYDCSIGLFLKKNSADVIYSSHFFEHLRTKDAMRLFKQSYSILKPGGIFRIALPNVVPDMRKLLNNEFTDEDRALMTEKRTMFRLEGKPNDIDYLNYMVFQYDEHKYVYTPQKIIDILEYVGFKDVRQVEFNKEYDLDWEIRRRGSFYVEGIK